MGPGCSKVILTFLGKFPGDKIQEETIGGELTGIGALTTAGWVCPDGVHWAAASTPHQCASSANGHSHCAQWAE